MTASGAIRKRWGRKPKFGTPMTLGERAVRAQNLRRAKIAGGAQARKLLREWISELTVSGSSDDIALAKRLTVILGNGQRIIDQATDDFRTWLKSQPPR